jgi:SSS family solute:Na+ symporter
MTEGLVALTVIVASCLILGIAGWVAVRGKHKTAADYFVAGRSLGYLILGFAYLVGFWSAFMVFGASGLAYRTGIMTASMWAAGSPIFYFLFCYLIHRYTYVLSKVRGWLSPAAIFGDRYGERARVTMVFLLLVATTAWLMAQVQGVGMALEAATFGLVPYHVGAAFLLAFLALYTAIGGFRGTAVIHAIQGFLVTFGMIAFALIAVSWAGGLESMMSLIRQRAPQLLMAGYGPRGAVWSLSMCMAFSLAMNLGSLSMPVPIMHAFASRKIGVFKFTTIFFSFLNALILICATMIGLCGFLLVPGLKGVEADKVFSLMAYKFLPVAAGAFFISLGIHAAISTIDHITFTNASCLVNDFVRRFIAPGLGDRQAIRLGRILVFALVAITGLLTYVPLMPVAELSVFGFATMSSALPALIGAYYWRRGTEPATVTSMIVGAAVILLTTLVWPKAGFLPVPEFGGLSGPTLGLVVSAAIYVIVSLATKPKATPALESFFKDLDAVKEAIKRRYEEVKF